MNLPKIEKSLLRLSVDLSRRLVYGAELIEGKLFVTDAYCAALVSFGDPGIAEELHESLRNAQVDYARGHRCHVIDKSLSMSAITSLMTASARGVACVSVENVQKVCNVLKSFGSCIKVCSHGPCEPLELGIAVPGAIVRCVIAPIRAGRR